MTKVFVIIALLAMSYLASADVNTYNLPLSINAKDIGNTYPALTCHTTDGKLYYLDHDGKNPILQVWDSSSKDQQTAIALSAQIADFITKSSSKSVVLQCLGTSVYLSVAYSNSTNTGIQQFLLTSSDQPSFALPLNSTTTLEDEETYLLSSCTTNDAKLYYMDLDINTNKPIVQVWDSASNTIQTPINATNLTLQVASYVLGLGDIVSHSEILQCIGNSAYINLGWSDENGSGVRLFLVEESDGNVTTYDLPLHNVDNASDAYLLRTTSSNDGKLYYLDSSADNTTLTLQEWDSTNNKLADSASLNDALIQMIKYIASLPTGTQPGGFLIQSVGKDVYINLAYSAGTSSGSSGIELFQIKKSAGILSFSFAALFLAVVALLF